MSNSASIIQLNKTKLVKQETTTAAGSTSVTFASEADAIRILVNLAATSAPLWWEVYEVAGNFLGSERLIYTSPTLTAPEEPVSVTIPGGQKLRITVHYDGVSTYHILGTGVGGAMALLQHDLDREAEVTDLGIANDKEYRTQVLGALCDMNDTLSVIANHLRLVTGVNEDDAETF